MDVRIDEAGHQGAIAEVDHFRTGWPLHRRSGFDDPVTLNENLARLHDLAGFNVEETGGVKHHGR